MELRSVEEPEIVELKERQNTDCQYELSALLDNSPPWTPMTLEQVKDAISKNQKKSDTSIFSIWVNDIFVGVGGWSSNWDTWAPWAHVIIWPEHRRKGYGTEAARNLLDRSFRDNPAHGIDAGAPEWNTAAISFLKHLGFREAGRMRLSGMRNGKYYDDLIFDMLKTEYSEYAKAPGKSLVVSQ